MENTTKYTPKRAAEGPSKKLPAGVVAGIAAAVVLALGIEALVVLRWMKKRRESASK